MPLVFGVMVLLSSDAVLLAQNNPLSYQRILTLTIDAESPNRAGDILVADTLTILPQSVVIQSNTRSVKLDSSYFTVKNTAIFFTHLKFPADVYTIFYKVIPVNIGSRLSRLDSTILNPVAPAAVSFETYSATKETLLDGGLTYNGNYTQGFSVGNTQNLVVSQNFNLNLAGRLGDIDVVASMTDNNLPIQAEGNTLQLREFDRIFIQLKKKNNTLIVGDYDLGRPNTHFLNYIKKLQGVQAFNATDILLKKTLTTTQTARLTTRGGVAITRGKFARNVLPTQEGNQGPYRLFGVNREDIYGQGATFFIVLANTEKIWMDGVLLRRGEENDYVIDYNRGDVVFTPKRLVTKDSRVIVEFEYADQSYLRSTLFLSNELNTKKIRLHFNFYNEQDAKNTIGTQSLDSLDREALRLVGRDFERAAPLSIRAVEDGFRSDRIQYRLVDTVVRGKVFNAVLVFSSDPSLARFTATFTPVGEGRGHYIQEATAANGRVYRWVAPDENGQLRGSFEPIKQLTPPNRLQMTTLGVDYQLFKNSKITTELAMTNNDVNRFSNIGDSLNIGLAAVTRLFYYFNFGKNDGWRWETNAGLELTQKNFRPLNPYRAPEFSREWNLPQANLPFEVQNTIGNLNARQNLAAEQLLNGGFKLSKNNFLTAQYDWAQFVRSALYRGERQSGRLELTARGYNLYAAINSLKTTPPPIVSAQAQLDSLFLEKTTFDRPNFGVSKTFKNAIKIGAQGERERNLRRDARTDTLTRAGYAFDIWRVFIEKPATINPKDSGKQTGSWSFQYAQRFDNQVFNKSLQSLSKVNEWVLNGILNQNAHQQLYWNLTYRNLTVSDTSRTSLRPQETYLGRVEYVFTGFKNALSGNTLYEIGSGQEQKLEYQYVRVNKGEGQYVWRNRNNDTIPQLDEFEIAPFQDQADYVRVSLFSNQFIRTNNLAFSQTLRFDPRVFRGDESSGFNRFIKRFSTNSSVFITRRVRDVAAVSQWNPFELTVPDMALVALTLQMRNGIFFNRGSSVWDAELGQTTNRNRVIVVTGFEERGREEAFLRVRLSTSSHLTLQTNLVLGNQSNQSEAFANRTFRLRYQKIEPQVNWLIANDIRLILSYKYRYGQNQIGGNERIRNNDISLETTWNQTTQAQVRGRLGYVHIAYIGARNTPVEFALLEGLSNGRNFLWQLNVDKNLSRFIILSFNYEGRKTGLLRTVHVGRAQIRANF